MKTMYERGMSFDLESKLDKEEQWIPMFKLVYQQEQENKYTDKTGNRLVSVFPDGGGGFNAQYSFRYDWNCKPHRIGGPARYHFRQLKHGRRLYNLEWFIDGKEYSVSDYYEILAMDYGLCSYSTLKDARYFHSSSMPFASAVTFGKNRKALWEHLGTVVTASDFWLHHETEFIHFEK